MPYLIARGDTEFDQDAQKPTRALLRRVRYNARKFGPKHRLRGPDEPWQGASRLPWFMTRLRHRMRRADYGQIIVVAHGTLRPQGEVTFRIKKVEPVLPLRRPVWAPTYLDGKVNDRIEKVAYAAYGWSDSVACLGAMVCRQISGSTTWSQHAYGNAIDLAIRKPPPVGFDLPVQDFLADYLVKNATELDLQHVIHRDRVWTRGYGWSRYLGQYHTHIHVDCTPAGYGTPECAR